MITNKDQKAQSQWIILTTVDILQFIYIAKLFHKHLYIV